MRWLTSSIPLFTITLTVACGPAEDRTDTTTGAPANTTARTEARNDGAIRTEVYAKYYANESTRGQRLDVEVDQGVATIRGTVPDEAAKRRAVEVADSVDGVTRVDDQITVRAPEQARTPDPDRADDSPAMITGKIQAKYFTDPDVKGRTIDVTTGAGGVVTLEGTVESPQEEAEAIRLARETEGVNRVDSRLRVQANAPREDDRRSAIDREGVESDTWLTTKIQAKYFIDADVRGRNIDVETRDGIVTLTGVVGTEAERRQAIALARNTDGVREVTDKLKVELAEADRSAARRPVADAGRPDPWITMKIQAQYFLDSEVKGHDIDVDTRQGIVTLTGAVETPQQKQEAELIAKETDGVRQVVNRLKVAAE